ncbi:MAG: sigma-70 family RNA polymerase sigma factor [Kiritimatiellae bacterium]|nr:sigma-70 family RNA polymerase sigma factor [Kiritimatiellia bacterium]
MARIPATSVSLIKEVSGDAGSARWAELYAAYRGPICDFMRSKYPTLEPDDVIQESMAALAKALPAYRYVPDEKGHFRNYLLGIVDHKAKDAIRRRAREDEKLARLRAEADVRAREEDDSWRNIALEVAIPQLMGDSSIDARHRQIFRHVALERENPEDVARRFGVTRNNVDQIKRRMTMRLSELVSALAAELG